MCSLPESFKVEHHAVGGKLVNEAVTGPLGTSSYTFPCTEVTTATAIPPRHRNIPAEHEQQRTCH